MPNNSLRPDTSTPSPRNDPTQGGDFSIIRMLDGHIVPDESYDGENNDYTANAHEDGQVQPLYLVLLVILGVVLAYLLIRAL